MKSILARVLVCACVGLWTLSAGCGDEGVPILDSACVDGTTRACHPSGGPAGEQSCVGGVWGACQSSSVCTEGATLGCTQANGAAGQKVCNAGVWGACQSTAAPCTEGATLACTQANGAAGQKVCNAGLWTACGPIPGQCEDGTFKQCLTVDSKDGTQKCEAGSWSPCTADNPPACQDGDKQACTSVCGVGSEICVGGAWQNCDAPKPAQEVCDGFDNNCDGQVDEVCGCVHGQCEVCYTGPEPTLNVGTCKVGQRCCNQGQWAPCTGQVLPAAKDDCADNLDNDCDGTVNNGCVCIAGQQQSCGTNTGECVVGKQTCLLFNGQPQWGACVGGVMPVAEAPIGCDGKDNDCDGVVDNGMTPDAEEVNDTCNQARHKVVEDDGTTVTVGATIYPSGDIDYYRISMNEVTAILYPDPCNPICFPPFCDPSEQCLYLEVEMVQPTGATYEATMLTGSCSSPSQSFATTSKQTLRWDGICNLDDSRDVWLKVAPKAGSFPAWSCATYQVKLRLTKENQPCPAS